MVSLVLGETGFFDKLDLACNNPVIHAFARQFSHVKWHGLHFWDLLLPSFMLLAGVSMAFSYNSQQKANYTPGKSFIKALKRSGWLLFWGLLIYSVRDNHLNLQFSNVLTELAFASFIAYLVIRLNAGVQLAVSISFLLAWEMLYRYSRVPGFDQPFTDLHNFGNYVDLLVIGRVNPGFGTTMNLLTCTGSTIWGLMAGQLLLSDKSARAKLTRLSVFGLIIMCAGFGLDLAGITPILKWISSSSFVLATGGITLLSLAICYAWIDVQKNQRGFRFFTIVGMNSIFIYLFFIFIGDRWLNGFAGTLVSGLLHLAGIPFAIGAVFACLAVFALEWGLCYFLYKKKLFFKL